MNFKLNAPQSFCPWGWGCADMTWTDVWEPLSSVPPSIRCPPALTIPVPTPSSVPACPSHSLSIG